MEKTAIVVIAVGTEEMEAVIIIDILRRGGITTTVAGIEPITAIKCSRGVVIEPDFPIDMVTGEKSYDLVVLPGGLEGAKTFCDSIIVGLLLKYQEEHDGWIGAICAAPTALKAHGVGLGKRVTSYPTMAAEMKEGYTYVDDKPVVVDGKIITSRAPGTAIQFALTLVEKLAGPCKANEVAKGMLVEYIVGVN